MCLVIVIDSKVGMRTLVQYVADRLLNNFLVPIVPDGNAYINIANKINFILRTKLYMHSHRGRWERGKLATGIVDHSFFFLYRFR